MLKRYKGLEWWLKLDKKDLKTFVKRAVRRKFKHNLDANPSRKDDIEKLPHYRN